MIPLLTVSVKTEMDVVAARLRARQLAMLCGFMNQDQIRIATIVSEVARNTVVYANGGRVSFAIEGKTTPQLFSIVVEDRGPGIDSVDVILSGCYISKTGMGKGLLGAKRLMDTFHIDTQKNVGTSIRLQKFLPKEAELISPAFAMNVVGKLDALPAEISATEILTQNQELLAALTSLKAKQEQLLQLTRELEDTNRGVVALYAELDEKADHLRRADEMKSRFLSNMSHEFRTPLSSIRALAKLLIDRVDGDLSLEQEKQVRLITQSALGLTDLVNDLLDIAKIESGRVDIHPQLFSVSETFSTLRGMLRPLLVSDQLTLNFIDPVDSIEMDQDEAKLSQILRNFISNALKFTERGTITVSAELSVDRQTVRFQVRDTGIGIAESDLGIIFEEFGQVANPLQRRVKGTGLGLPLCQKLATLLQGDVEVESALGEGSLFSLILPRVFLTDDSNKELHRKPGLDQRIPVLVVEDNPHNCMLYDKYLENSEFTVLLARSLREADAIIASRKPAVIILDVMLYGESSWEWLANLKRTPILQMIPVVVATEINDKRKGLSLGADAYFLKPLFKYQLLTTLRGLLKLEKAVETQQGA
jgi:signal transduction histidine kinase/ActR/RegA family two-component response regulator